MKLIRTDWDRLLHEHFMFGSTSEGRVCLSLFFFSPWFLSPELSGAAQAAQCKPLINLKNSGKKPKKLKKQLKVLQF